jgi:hypothetical protein
MSQDRIARLQEFVDWSTQHITGDEKGQAQIFLDRLFQAFGQPGSLDVGGSPEFRIKKGKEEQGGTSFADYVWKPVVLIEMKKRGIDLAKTRQQAFDYWIKLVPNRPQYTILCNFDEFWIYDFNVDLDEPLDKVALKDLPARYDPLAFLFPTREKPVFQNNRVEVTRQAADRLAAVFNHMVLRKVPREEAQRFVLQTLVALFAEDIDLLPRNFFTNLLTEIKTPEDSYDLLGGLFDAMNNPKGTPAGRFKGVRYFNGGLFKNPAKLALDDNGIELAHLREAAKPNWSKVSPDIFGTLFQHSMDQPERHAYGAHYTAPIDIMKIVRPTIVEPWTHLIDAAKTPKKLADLLERLNLYTVLDPACGSGNFLYLAYRELKRLESKIRDRLKTEFPDFQAPIYHVTAKQFHGIDILPFAIELAKVTMMLGRKLAIDELHIVDEPPLPLDNLDQNFKCEDALMTKGLIIPWSNADVIIGNPPFLGAKRLKPERGPDYVNNLRDLYPEVPGMADYCVYWFKRAHDHLPLCTPDRPESGRAGLVGTQNIRNNQSRVGGLDHIVESGTIIEAVDNQPWSGEANVHVSIANWVKTAPSNATPLPSARSQPVPSEQPEGLPPHSRGQSDAAEPHSAAPGKRLKKAVNPEGVAPPAAAKPFIDPSKLLIPTKKKLWFKVDPKLALFNQGKSPKAAVTTTGKSGKTLASKSYELDFREIQRIGPSLSENANASSAKLLSCNFQPKRVFQGITPGHSGFVLEPSEKEALINKDNKSARVIWPYLIGRELLTGDGTPERFVIDFEQRTLLEAQAFPRAFERVRATVLPDVQAKATGETGADQSRRQHLMRWWQHWRGRADRLAEAKKLKRCVACSRVTKRPIFVFIDSSIRPSDVVQSFMFDDDYSFGILQSSAHWLWFTTNCSKLTERFRYTPESVFDTFPWPQSPTKKQIDAVAAAGREIRRIRADALQKMTGGLRALYRTLELPGKNPLKDAHAALDTATLAAYGFDPKADLLAQLLTLNLQVAANIEAGESVTAPGIPSSYPAKESLISEDCVSP